MKINYIHSIGVAVLSAIVFLQGCSTTKPYTKGPVKTFDPDTARIEKPEEKPQYQYWDRIDNTIFHQLEKPLNLNRTGRWLGQGLGISDKRQADNINKLDEVPESSWYTYRHYYDEMSPKELAAGPNTKAPDTKGEWTIFKAKLEGANSGFFIEDENGNRYLIKFDGYDYPELTTAAEVIGTKVFYAAGYTVPESEITYFDPGNVTIAEGVTVEEGGEKRAMTVTDYQEIVKNRPQNADGKVRALASKFVDGVPLGPWNFEGTLKGDPNDRVAHEHRRELRGMRVISSWLNDTDRRDANTMAVYNNEGYIGHYVQDFGNTLGANGMSSHKPIQGQAYLIDPRYMLVSAVSLGGYITPWETVEPEVPYPSVGYFRSDVFKPGRWVPTHPLPPFENMTLRDAFWGAKHVMSFSDEDIRTIVETGQYSNPKAEEYIVRTLIERRDKIGRHWFAKINPLDKFDAEIENKTLLLTFTDLSVNSGLVSASNHKYRVEIESESKVLSGDREINEPQLSVELQDEKLLNDVLRFDIKTIGSEYSGAGKMVMVYIEVNDNNSRVVRVRREE
ncbi:hypothetical protein CK503_02550 [Aliifodinibius salipaludis]|uniref:Uncharacterized protein n=1 Tax=Fodinibius salipaludis TaxID=2032627 RepID=A0A2A2GDZ3_9BACT|nr:hypothetical protein [Aliifodinibius salipaludis]PAU95099.1 hypothetical protein CK503_02550 [Aliifodinibius salipaludis]